MMESIFGGMDKSVADLDGGLVVELSDETYAIDAQVYREPPARMARDATCAAPDGLRLGSASHRAAPQAEGELRCGQARLRVGGRALRLIAWLATHQERINQCAAESGQLWLTWKGDGPQSISGDIRTRL